MSGVNGGEWGIHVSKGVLRRGSGVPTLVGKKRGRWGRPSREKKLNFKKNILSGLGVP